MRQAIFLALSSSASGVALACALALGIAVGSGHPASATPIGPGTDLFITVPGNPAVPGVGTEVDLSFLLPSVGVIALQGVPILGQFDTIIERQQGIDPLNDCPNPPCSDTIDIELVALSLVSVSPVDLSDLGGPFLGVFSDVFFTINKGGAIFGLPQPDVLDLSIGRMEIIHTDPLGGTFTSCLGNPADPAGVCVVLGVAGGGVYADAIFTVPGGDPSNPLDVFFSAAAPRLAVSGLNGLWEHNGVGDDFRANQVQDTCNFPPCHLVTPVPEPSTAPLAGLGLLALSGYAARRRVRSSARKA